MRHFNGKFFVLALLATPVLFASCKKKTFKDLALKKGLKTGIAVTAGDLYGEKEKQIVLENSAMIVSENSMKWANLRPNEKFWNWGDIDAMIKFAQENGIDLGCSVDALSQEDMKKFIEDHNVPCPSCGKHNFTDIRQFNLMFKTFQGVTEDAKNTVYLRPETAQGIFVNFKNVQRTSRKKVPFGIGQIGKSFRNEITPGNFTFRTREFEQMELEFFCKPDTDLEWFAYWKDYCVNWLKTLGIKEDEMRIRDHEPEELSFYSKATSDIEFLFPFGWGELWGIADRTDYDLTCHQNVSGEDMAYFDDEEKRKYIPYVIEPSLGADRVTLAFLCAAYDEEEIKDGDVRTVMHFHPAIAPVKIGVLPLSKKLGEGAEKIYQDLCKIYNCEYDDRGNIGKRYRRQDEIGTPYCITYDFDSVEDGSVTVRDRDTMEQERIKIEDLKAYFEEKFAY